MTDQRKKRQTIDEKIEAAQNKVFRLKDQYEAALAELDELLKKKRAVQEEKLIKAFEHSTRSYEDIISFIEGKPSGEEDE